MVQFDYEPLVVRSPGRINLIGEHTDYNDGFVMPAAIDKGITFSIAPSKDGKSVIYAENYGEVFTVPDGNLSPIKEPNWVNYLLGVLHKLRERATIPHFTCSFKGDLPIGAGMSSSAALECGFAFALNECFQLAIPKAELIVMAQWAEHNYAGVRCGIMDQFSSMMGKEDHAILLDCRSLAYRYLPLSLNEYTLLLCNSNVKHSLASSEYNTRRAECEEGIRIIQKKYPEVKSLRDVSINMIQEHPQLFSPEVYNRCRYVVEENIRVTQAATDLENGDLKAFGEKMFATHEGLSKQYAVSCKELDFLVEQAKQFEGVLGSRMMGGGFGGCTINLVALDSIDRFIKTLEPIYRNAFGIELSTYQVNVANGTAVVPEYNTI